MHEQFLLKALEQAKQGRGRCAPNPAVGAVAVHNGVIIAQTSHQGAGSLHAEVLLLAQIPPQTPGVTLYSTLEPCNHWGKTPPCVDAIIEHGIEHVVFAYKDPNPIVCKNNSTEQLQKAGIQVTHHSIADIDAFYQSYAYWTATKKPWVTVKMAQSMDGKIAGAEGERVYLSNESCATFTHELRARCDILLTTAKTIQQDNPRMNVRLNGMEYAKPIAIIDSTLSSDHQAHVFSKATQCHVYHTEGNPTDTPNIYHHLMPSHQGAMDLEAIIQHLGSLGYHDVFVEAGGTLFTALHRQGLVSRTYVYVTPKALGNHALSAYQHEDVFEKPHSVSWHIKEDNAIACFEWRDASCLQES